MLHLVSNIVFTILSEGESGNNHGLIQGLILNLFERSVSNFLASAFLQRYKVLELFTEKAQCDLSCLNLGNAFLLIVRITNPARTLVVG